MSDKEKKEIDDNVERMLAEAFHDGKDISLLFEDEQDINFWTNIFNAFAPHLKLDIPYSSPKGANGKGELLKYKNNVSKKLVICRDSDNEYLYTIDDTFSKPYIYHTYTYNLENNLCYENLLNIICKEITEKEFFVSKILKKYSELIYDILIYWIYFNKPSNSNKLHLIKNNKGKSKLSWNNYNHCELKDVLSIEENIESVSSLSDFDDFFGDLKNKVDIFLNEINTKIDNQDWLTDFLEKIKEVKVQLAQDYQITPDKTLYYINGHIVYSFVVIPLMEKVISLLQIEKEKEINQQYTSANKRILTEKQGAYKNRVENKNLKTMLSESYKNCFWRSDCDCEFMEKIRIDLHRDFNS
jgi:hypothetical protein